MRSKKYVILLLCTTLNLFCKAQPIDYNSGKSISKELKFYKNNGQIRSASNETILYSATAENGTIICFQKNKISYILKSVEEEEENEEEEKTKRNFGFNPMEERIEHLEKKKTTFHRIDVTFEGTNNNVDIIAEEKQKEYAYFYYNHCKKGIKSESYKKIIYKNIYPNIDIIFKNAPEKGMEYDFIIRPGGDPKNIQIRYEGADRLQVEDRKIKMYTNIGRVEDFIPEIFQMINGKKKTIEGSYAIGHQNKKEATVRLNIENYDKEQILIVDPWSTFYGGSAGDDDGFSIANDKNGNVLVTGSAGSNDFPATIGSMTMNGTGDAFILKLDHNGQLIWASYFGGSKGEVGNGITADKSNDIIVTGFTTSTDLPILNAAQPLFGDSIDVFVSKFDPNGTLIFSTYLGGTRKDIGNTVACDRDKNVLVTGYTSSTNNIFSGGFQNTNSGDYDSFITKYDANGVRLWSTYYGGTRNDAGNSIATDSSKNVIVVGYTQSSQYPTAPIGAYQSTFGGGSQDAFAIKLDANGNRLWNTYFGGSFYDQASSVATDSKENVIFTGTTQSSDFPISTGAVHETTSSIIPIEETFITKLDSSGGLLWSTYFNAQDDSEGGGIAIDTADNILIVGGAENPNMPTTPCAYHTSYEDQFEEGFLAKFDTSGNLLCSTFLSWTENYSDAAWGYSTLALSGTEANILIYSKSLGTVPINNNPIQSQSNGHHDVFIMQICANLCNLSSAGYGFNADQTTICVGTSVNFTTVTTNTTSCGGSSTYAWSFPGAVTPSSSSANPTGIIYNTPGTYDVTMIANDPCGTDTITYYDYIYVADMVTLVLSNDTAVCQGKAAPLSAGTSSGSTLYYWSPASGLNTTYGPNVISTTTSTTQYYVTGVCGEKDSVLVTIWPLPSITVSPSNSICIDNNYALTASGTDFYSWSPATSLNITSGPIVITNTSASIVYSVIGTDTNGCPSTPVSITIHPTPAPNFIADKDSGCVPLTVVFSDLTSPSPFACLWQFGDGSTSTNCNPTHLYNTTGIYTVKLIVTSNAECVDSLTNNNMITVFPNPTASFVYDPQVASITNPSISFTDQSISNYDLTNWNWSFGNQISDSSIIQNPTFAYQDSGHYQVTLIITDANGCKDTTNDEIYIEPGFIFYAPNSFTPNDDNMNEYFNVYASVISSFSINIFDRWGNIVFGSSNINNGWDGRIKNSTILAQEDVYIYVADIIDYKNDKHQFVGRVTVIR